MPPPPVLPTIHILFPSPTFSSAFTTATQFRALPPSIKIHHHTTTLSALPSSLHFDAILAPTDAYARMSGGFSAALSRALSPSHAPSALERVAQEQLFAAHRGFLVPGNCLLVSLDDTLLRRRWGARWIALCATTRAGKGDVRWDREVVYECVWAVLVALSAHNARVRLGEGEGEIKSVLMTPLATGSGGWSAERWAAQTVLAVRHFVEAGKGSIEGRTWEVEQTWGL
ncbi:macro domain-like protein [Bimuria novae-zelandiae CBS 107.79]|uniref:Macro domain-like protein n=1 Tax=Bimuria novae-zelandiae CBS 107.79 TaxID=1447943 RepID=A0A6A5W106_9PLEO|nr:macro domain-like protein [Bimuria novae-zelandiae CBS 107.79]